MTDVTESLVERATKAHYEASHDMRVETPWEDCHPDYKAQKVSAMRAAIAAMLEPTPDMSTAGKHAVKGCESTFERDIAETAYAVMIQAALAEETR